ncbi:MAG TPA: APC family permease [Gemmatimonadales bacterium]|nr:APC family permease [Gemmatimonadales bacterium]
MTDSTAQAPAVAVPAPRGRLLQILGVAFGLAVIIGNTIGVGILRTPGDVAAHLPDTRWFLGAWVLGGVYALLGALSLAELGAMVPESGGQYVFVRRAIGEYAGFAVGWSDWLSSCAAMALVTVSMGDYTAAVWPALQGKAVHFALTIVAILTVIQAVGIRAGDLTQQVSSLLKTLVLVALAVVCLLWTPPATSEATVSAAAPHVIGFGAIVLALQGVIYTYDGWNGMLYFGGEVKNPGRDIPRAMAGGVLAVIAIYLLLNVAFLHVLPPERMAGQDLVAATAAREIFGDRGDTVVRGVLLVSLFSAANAILLISSRLPYAMSRDGMVWHGLARVSESGTPRPSLYLSALATAILLITGTFDQILALAAFFYVVCYTASFVSVFILRAREPNTPRPYRAIGFPWVTGFLVLGSLAFLVGNVVSDTKNSLVELGILVASYPVFLLVRGRVRR